MVAATKLKLAVMDQYMVPEVAAEGCPMGITAAAAQQAVMEQAAETPAVVPRKVSHPTVWY